MSRQFFELCNLLMSYYIISVIKKKKGKELSFIYSIFKMTKNELMGFQIIKYILWQLLLI